MYSESAFGDSNGLFQDGETEVSFLYCNGRTYAMTRSSGTFCVSDDEGRTWRRITDFQDNGERNIMQPYLIRLNDQGMLINWTERLAPENRAVFGKIYEAGTEWDEYPDALIYGDRYGVDMGDPSSVLLDDGSVLTIFYDTGVGKLGRMINNIDSFR